MMPVSLVKTGVMPLCACHENRGDANFCTENKSDAILSVSACSENMVIPISFFTENRSDATVNAVRTG